MESVPAYMVRTIPGPGCTRRFVTQILRCSQACRLYLVGRMLGADVFRYRLHLRRGGSMGSRNPAKVIYGNGAAGTYYSLVERLNQLILDGLTPVIFAYSLVARR